jgi:hypothetical protein
VGFVETVEFVPGFVVGMEDMDGALVVVALGGEIDCGTFVGITDGATVVFSFGDLEFSDVKIPDLTKPTTITTTVPYGVH